jgi:L-ribulokinase
MPKYTIGIDYGTLSARALLLDLQNGAEVAVSEYVYPHTILQPEYFAPNSMDPGMSLQHPGDYLEALKFTIRDVMQKAGISADDVCGIGFDFTSCSVLPVTADGTPLCFLKEFQNEPHAYVKLWNSYSAQEEAEIITTIAAKRNESWLKQVSGKVSAEWLFPKLYETLRKAPQVFQKADRYMEYGDWITWQLTGKQVSSASFAGFKALWNPQTGYPDNTFWASVDPRMGDIIGTKVGTNVHCAGTLAGYIDKRGQELTGLNVGTAVSVPLIDAHAPMCSSGAVGPGQLLLTLGTSAAFIVMDTQKRLINGIFSSTENGILPGLTAYDASQPSMGNTFAWFMENCVPAGYAAEAKERGISLFQLLDEKAAGLKPGGNGLLVLDWWNGNRAPYNDFDLSGIILGLTLKTKPEEIYRAIIESCAFAARTVRDLYQNGGITIHDIRAGGGIARKNPMLMQLYADVLGTPIRVADSAQPGAKGGAIFAAVASGVYDDVYKAAEVLADQCETVYVPREDNRRTYDALYEEYRRLCVYFAEGENPVMKRLRNL